MTEAKGSDVRAAEPHWLSEPLHNAWLKYAHLFGEAPHGTIKQMAALIEFGVRDAIEARVQAAAVDMRERCAKASYSFIAAENIRRLPIPTDALDAMLQKARIEEHEEVCNSPIDCERLGDLRRQLAALTQPAPEQKEK